MTRTAFLAALEQLLAPLPEAERKDALSYYEDYLDAAGPENEARAIAELGSPEEVARKILDEQSPQGVSAAPASPARKPHSRWRMVLGGGLAVLVLACFFFQHSKATPVQPVEPVSSASEIPASSAEVSAESTQPQAVDSVSASDGLTFSLSAEMVHDKLSLKLDYGTFYLLLTQMLLTSRCSLMALGPGTSPIPAKKLGPQSFPTIFPNTTLSLIPTALCSPLPFRKISCMRWTLILLWGTLTLAPSLWMNWIWNLPWGASLPTA